MQSMLDKVAADIELRNYSERTARLYLWVCRDYIGFLGGKPLGETDEPDVRACSLRLSRDRGLAARTVDRYLAAVMFMYEVGLDRAMNRRRVPYMKRPKTLPCVFSRDEVAAILASASRTRDRALISLGYGSGLRASEACALRTCDVDSGAMRLFVHKGKGDKLEPLVAESRSMLEAALRRDGGTRRLDDIDIAMEHIRRQQDVIDTLEKRIEEQARRIEALNTQVERQAESNRDLDRRVKKFERT